MKSRTKPALRLRKKAKRKRLKISILAKNMKRERRKDSISGWAAKDWTRVARSRSVRKVQKGKSGKKKPKVTFFGATTGAVQFGGF